MRRARLYGVLSSAGPAPEAIFSSDTVRRVSTGLPRITASVVVWLTLLSIIGTVVAPLPSVASQRRASRPEAYAAVAASVPVGALIGQKLVVAMHGTVPSDALLGRVQRGEVGGVILFGANVRTAGQLARITRRLRAAAAAGGQPPLLITTDQEGGSVKRLPWAPPTLSPPQMGAIGSTDTAFQQGMRTGHLLACAGLNGNLAPVADVPESTSSFLYQQGRTWSFDASLTASLSDAFASGLEAGADIPAMKHFPGLGFATRNTDDEVVTIDASADELDPGLRPYRRAIGHAIPMIMLSNASYPAYSESGAAGWSTAISLGLLRDTLGFEGVSITDSLNGTAAARGVSATDLAIRAAKAGTDMILLTGTESGSSSTYQALVAAANAGTIPHARLKASYDRILAMKAAFPAVVSDDTAPADVAMKSPSLLAGTVLGGSSADVLSQWSASDDCGIASYDLRRRTGSGDFIPQPLPDATATSAAQPLQFGTRYAYSIAAVDGAGNKSAALVGMAFRMHRAQEDDADVTYTGDWDLGNDPDASGGAFAFSTTAHARASFSFTGFGIAWAAVRGPSHGSASVYLDGNLIAVVDLHASTHQERRIVFSHRWGQSGAHRITIINRGTSGHSHVSVDALLTLAPA